MIDDRARVWDTWPKTSQAEFQRKVRTLAGNYQLVQKAPWLLRSGNRLRFQLISHKLLRLAVPFFLLSLLLANFTLRDAQPYATILVGQAVFYGLALAGLVWDPKLLRRITAPASALVLMNAAAVVALFMFLFRSRSLLGLWVSPEAAPEEQTARAAPELCNSKRQFPMRVGPSHVPTSFTGSQEKKTTGAGK